MTKKTMGILQDLQMSFLTSEAEYTILSVLESTQNETN